MSIIVFKINNIILFRIYKMFNLIEIRFNSNKLLYGKPTNKKSVLN